MPRRLEAAAIAAVMALAALLRLGWTGVHSFAFDEASLSLIALKMARGEAFAALGMPSSTGVPNLPAAAWIMAVPYRLSADPLVATLFVGVISLGAVLGVWWLARTRWGVWAGLTAALYLAASPYGALYARNIWSQNFLPPLAVGWLVAAVTGSTSPHERRRRWARGVTLFLAGFAFQVHPAGMALIPGTAWIVWRWRWYRQPLPLIIGGGLAALMLLPFGIQVACCSPDLVDQYRTTMDHPASLDLTSVKHTVSIALGRGWSYLALGSRDDLYRPSWQTVSVGLLLILGLIAVGRDLLRRGANPPGDPRADDARQPRMLAELTLVLLIMAPLLFLRHSIPVNSHYMLPSLPALALIAGASTRLIPHRAWGPAVLLGSLILAGLWSVQIGQALDKAGDMETPGGLGTPLGVVREAAYGVPDDAPVLFFTAGDDPGIDGEAATFAALWWGRDYRIVQGESVLILPPYPAYLMATLQPFQAWEEITDSGLALSVRTFDRREGALPFVMTRYDGQQMPQGFTPVDPPVALADGVQLEGWRVRQVGPRLRVSTLWRVTQAPPPGVYRQFHHLRDATTLEASTPPLTGADVPLSSQNWRVGDLLIFMGDFVWDGAGPYWVDVGHYTLPSVIRFPRVDGQGDSIRLGPFDASGQLLGDQPLDESSES